MSHVRRGSDATWEPFFVHTDSRRTRILRNAVVIVFFLGVIQGWLLSENIGTAPAIRWGIGIPLVVLLFGLAAALFVSLHDDSAKFRRHDATPRQG